MKLVHSVGIKFLSMLIVGALAPVAMSGCQYNTRSASWVNSEISCQDNECVEKRYNAAGQTVETAVCSAEDKSTDGKSCKKYRGIRNADYDEKGRTITERVCTEDSLRANGKSCKRYDEIAEYEYDDEKDLLYHVGICDRTGISADGKSCREYQKLIHFSYFGNYMTKDTCSGDNIDRERVLCKEAERSEILEFDQEGKLLTQGACHKNSESEDSSCVFDYKIWYDNNKKVYARERDSWGSIVDYTYDGEEKVMSKKYCNRFFGMGADGQSCDSYYGIGDYVYDEAGRPTALKICSERDMGTDGKSCNKYGGVYSFSYDEDGNLTSEKYEGENRSCGRTKEIEEYNYNKAGELISKRKEEYFAEDGWLDWDYLVTESSYGKAGELISKREELHYMKEVPWSFWDYEVTEFNYDQDGNLISKREELYLGQKQDTNKSDSKKQDTNEDDSVIYNEDGTIEIVGPRCWLPLPTEEEVPNTDYIITTYSYDKFGRLVSTTTRGKDKTCETVDYGYNEEGKRIFEKACYSCKPCDRYTEIIDYSYDDAGKLTSVKGCAGGNVSANGNSCDRYDNGIDGINSHLVANICDGYYRCAEKKPEKAAKEEKQPGVVDFPDAPWICM